MRFTALACLLSQWGQIGLIWLYLSAQSNFDICNHMYISLPIFGNPFLTMASLEGCAACCWCPSHNLCGSLLLSSWFFTLSVLCHEHLQSLVIFRSHVCCIVCRLFFTSVCLSVCPPVSLSLCLSAHLFVASLLVSFVNDLSFVPSFG